MIEEYKRIIREKLDDYRFHHSLCVADEAQRLAIKYGLDKDKAYIAGLLHDVTKNISFEEHLKLASRFGIMLNDTEIESPNILHGITGSAYMKCELGIKDEDIISAVRYHTTAKADMSLFEKIIYLADFTSADRKYPDVNVMRDLVDKNLLEAMHYSLSYTIKSLVSKGSVIHPDTLYAYNFVIEELKIEEKRST